jgi:hypothetical protein
MNRIFGLAAALALGIASLTPWGAIAQTAPAQPAAKASPNTTGDETKKQEGSGSSAEATEGRNSFTEGQAKSRIEKSGFSDVTGLAKDDKGVWNGKATKDGKQVNVQVDFQGDVLVRP